jgi:predicted dehydrogenase
MSRSNVHRRDFLKASAAGAAALSLTAASARRVVGANERLGIAFLGTGGRCQEHIGIITHMQKENKGVEAVAVCDVWDGNKKVGRGLYFSAERCGLKADDPVHVTKDYRRVLDLKEVDAVCIATPDHWHAKMSIDAAKAGKAVYCEKPMTRTIEEAHAVVDTMKQHNRVMTVGVQSMADPTWRKANEIIREGRIGHVAQAQTSYYRNYIGGQWRYYMLTKDMNPKTVDWDMFLGNEFHVIEGVPLGPKMPFDRAVYGQWRCYWPFGGGMFTDLFVHQTTHMIAAMGVRYPARVVGGGGIYLEYDGRDVPDVATIIADYDEGCQLIVTATMINDYPIDECIRGRLATIRFNDRPGDKHNGKATREFGLEILPQGMMSGPGLPKRPQNLRGEFIPGGLTGLDTAVLWENFLHCVRDHNRETFSPPELGAAAFTTVNMGVQSYRQGKALFWDKEARQVKPADASWADRWEKRSKEHGKPNQVMGWHGGDSGSVVIPPDYQKLGGPWVNGKDPAEHDATATSGR